METVAFNAAYKQALAAYNNAAGIAGGGPAQVDSNSSGFISFIGDALKNLNKSLATAEASSGKAAVDQGDITQVVTSVGEAELALQTVIAVRDRAIAAYQDIIKMPI